jgi:hypothetical protein
MLNTSDFCNGILKFTPVGSVKIMLPGYPNLTLGLPTQENADKLVPAGGQINAGTFFPTGQF